ncbi:RNA polymerase sigma factor [Marinobacter fonticola]|uniref:RNA polymerase sigma factor n=1 Tax=Marinobacter fonticola TaxID=2603215 RepID=UPI0011E70AEE|nr:RNA polymerase sigma factor [Marinobacter fonticola]
MTADSTTDEHLLAGLQDRDPATYRLAVRTYSPTMLAVARCYVAPDKAEDVVQECWLKIIDAIDSFEGRSSLKTWLCRIVANRCKNAVRTADREINVDFSDALDPTLGARFGRNGRWTQPPRLQTHETAEHWLENEALKDCLDKHLSSLPENQRTALILYEAHQRCSEDICNILRISPSNLRVMIHRARQRIFLMLEHFQETGEC